MHNSLFNFIEYSEINNIPNNIFQTWETKNIGQKLLYFSNSWKNNNLDFEYYLFDKNDLWRYCILY